MMRNANLLAVACSVTIAALTWCATSTAGPAVPLGEERFDDVVGQLAHHCCKPGRRWGCDATTWPLPEGCHYPVYCPQGVREMMNCTNGDCVWSNQYDECDYSPQEVGKNECIRTGLTINCGIPVQCGLITCYMHKCMFNMYIAWNDPLAPIDYADVCDGLTTCDYDYSKCEGAYTP